MIHVLSPVLDFPERLQLAGQALHAAARLVGLDAGLCGVFEVILEL